MNLLEILKKNADNAKSYIDGLVSKKQDTLTFDTAPTEGSQNPVTSDGIQKAIAAKTVDFSNYPTKNGTGATGTWPISISGAATKASQDSNGKVIADTYAKKTGEGASGTWDISITGNAVTANQAANDGAGNVITDTYTQKKEIKVSTDLDTLKETGFYNFPLSSICTDANHFPWGVASAVLVIKNGANGDGCTQICFPYNQEKFCKRTYMASTQKWHDWDTSAFMADLDSKQDKLVFDTAPTASSANAITSGAVKAYVDAAIAAIVDGDSKTY